MSDGESLEFKEGMVTAMQKNILPEEARAILYGLPSAPKTECVRLIDALGRVLAEDVVAEVPIPPFDRSPYDGYAIRAEDTDGASRETPITLQITEEIPAGAVPTVEITPGFAAKILTGAPIPRGANATVKFEVTEFTDTEVRLFSETKPFSDYVYAGSDVAVGTIIARSGDVITPPMMGLLASEGRENVSVFRSPSIAIINTGSELQEPGTPLEAAKIYNSSVFTLTGYLRQFGAVVQNCGVVRDDAAEIAERIRIALADNDLVITTGGASVGDYDFALGASEELGAQIAFWKVKMRPGGALAASLCGEKAVLALSGSPGAAVLQILLIASPYIKKLCGRTDCGLEPFELRLKKPFAKSAARVRLLRGSMELAGGEAYFIENGVQGGGDISSFCGNEVLAEIPAGSEGVAAGTLVRAYRI